MTRIRIDIPTESRSVELDVRDHSVVKDVISQVWKSGDLEGTSMDDQISEGELSIRIKRRSEPGRWWSEQEIKDYRDRELACPVDVIE